MIIGIDCGALSIKDNRLKVGVWRVTVELLKQLSKKDTHNTYRLYSFLPIEKTFMKQLSPRMHNVVLSPSLGYAKIRLPFELALNPVDCFIGLSQALPSFVRTPMIGVIYDVAFLHMKDQYGTSSVSLQKQTEDIVKRSKRIITISEASKRDITHMFHVSSDRIDVCYPGIDTRFTSHGEKKNFHTPYILYVGALKRAKNIPTLLESYALFLKKSKKVYDLVLIGGDYWMDPNIQKTIASCNVESHVKILGHLPDQALPLWYRGATVFASIAPWEGFCMPVVEAMASGVPVIGANTGSMPEVIGKSGILVSPDKPTDIANALEKVCTNTELQKDMRSKGKKQAKKFTWEQFGASFYSTIQRV